MVYGDPGAQDGRQKGSLLFILPNKIRHRAAGIVRVGDAGGLACLDALEQPCHVAAQFLHDGAALFVLKHLLGLGAMHHGPVGAVDQRHMEELGVLDQLIEGGGGSGAAGRAADGGGLVGQILAACVRQTIHEAGHVAGGRRIMDRAAEHEGIGGLGLLDGLVDHAAEDAAVAGGTAAAADAAAHGLGADVEDLRLDACGVQLARHQRQRGIGAALGVGAAVDEQDFHSRILSFLRRKTPGALV